MSEHVNQIYQIYHQLYLSYGPQGWWPLINFKGKNPHKKGIKQGYHPLNYDLPRERDQIFEVIIGAILTQNTSWMQASAAVDNLNQMDALKPEKLIELKDEEIKSAIKCAGFLNQKSTYLKEITRFFIELDDRTPVRYELLQVKGIGPETADSILLYAYKVPEFVVDTYTRRIFAHLKIVDENIKYEELKGLFESNLTRDVPVYQEYHALLVEHAKRYYNKKPYVQSDPLLG
jgi:endonuclease-3 related protein